MTTRTRDAASSGIANQPEALRRSEEMASCEAAINFPDAALSRLDCGRPGVCIARGLRPQSIMAVPLIRQCVQASRCFSRPLVQPPDSFIVMLVVASHVQLRNAKKRPSFP